MKFTHVAAFAAALAIALASSAAQAATLYISEFPNAMSAVGTTQPQVPPQPKIADQTVGLSGSTAVSSAFNSKTHAVMLMCDEGCSIQFGGSSVTATTSNYLLQQGVPYTFAVSPSTFVAAIANSAGDTGGGGGGGGNVTIVSPIPLPVEGTGTSGTPAGGVLTIQGQTSMEPVQVNAADGADVTQGAIADSAYVGSGNATVVSALKGIYASVNGAIPAGSAIIGKVGIDQTTPGTTNGVQVNAALPAGSNVIGHVIADTGSTTAATQATAANLNATVVGTGTFAVQAQPTPVTSGGLSWYFVQPAASDNHVVIKAGAGQVYHIAATNNSATINYIRLYNATTGFNGCNSATNIVGQWAVPASTSGAGLVADITQGIAFATGISICVTSGYATNDTTNATASAMSIDIGYK